MTAAACTLAGYAVSRLTVQLPAWGVWWADVDLVDAVELSGAVSLVVADATLTGTIVSGGAANGRAAYRVAGGAGAWGTELAARPYANDAGVKASLVLSDAAREVGETLAAPPGTSLGTHFARDAGPASMLLHSLAPRAWYVDLDGVTRFGAQAASTYSGTAVRVRVDPGVGVIDLAVDEGLASLVPGVSVDGSAAATDVEWALDGGRLTARVYAGAAPSRRLDAMRRLFDAMDPRRRFRGLSEYRVVTQSGERLNLQAVRAASGMPDLARVPVRLAPGVKATHAPGSFVLVAFADADPARPCVVAGDAAGTPGWMPTTLSLLTADDHVALASLVDDRMGAVRDWVNGHVHSGVTAGTASTAVATPPLWMPADPPTGYVSVAGEVETA